MPHYTAMVPSLWLNEASRKILTAFIPLIILWLVYLVKKQREKPLPLPPGPFGLPLVGYLPFVGSNLHRTFRDLAITYGPIFKVRLGTKQLVVITSPSLMKEVVRDRDLAFANRDPSIAATTFSFGGSDIAFSNYGREFSKLKKILISEVLSDASLDSSYCFRKQEVRRMIEGTYEKAMAREQVDIGELAFLTLSSSLVRMAMGSSVDAGEFLAVSRELLNLLEAPNVSDFFPLLARFDFQGIKRRADAVVLRFEKILDHCINHHRGEGEEEGQEALLGQLLRLAGNQTSMTLPQLKALLVDFLVGGMDTQATTVEWVMSEVLQHPTVMRKIQEELTETVGLKCTVEEAHLPRLRYLAAVFNETLRLHPSVPLLAPHCPSSSTAIGGYAIPKAAMTFLNVWAVQRDPQVWDDPLGFHPERFLKDPSAERPDFRGNHLGFLPFGSGRRMCPGIPLAERMSVHLLASLLHAFEWKLPDGTAGVDFSDRYQIVLKKARPLVAVPSPRLSCLELYSDQQLCD